MTPKFRAWDKKYKYMGEVKVIDFEHEKVLFQKKIDRSERHIYFDEDYQTILLPLKNVILMQSLGFTDRYGKEVFEGDILSDKGYNQSGLPNHDVIEHSPLEHNFISVREGNRTGLNLEEYEHWIVIGNIYQNPKLKTAPRE